MKRKSWFAILLVACMLAIPTIGYAEKNQKMADFTERTYGFEEIDKRIIATSTLFRYDSGLTFEYPDAVRGIYVTGHSAGGARFQNLVDLIDSTDLNAMVIDIKDDFGNLTYIPEGDSSLATMDIGKSYIKNPRALLEELEEKKIYPIGRIVVFKDTVLAEKRPGSFIYRR